MAQLQITLDSHELEELAEYNVTNAEIDMIHAINADVSLDTVDFCSLYRSKFRVPLRKVRNTLKKLRFIPFIGSKPYEALAAIMKVLDNICPE